MNNFASHIKIEKNHHTRVKLNVEEVGESEQPTESMHIYVILVTSDLMSQYLIDDIADPLVNLQFVQSAGLSSLPRGLFFKPDKTAFYTLDLGDDTIKQYTMTAPGDISTASLIASQSVGSGAFTDSVRDVYFKDDGTILYITDAGDNYIYEYVLSTAWDITTATLNHTLSVAAPAPTGLFILDDGQTIFMVDNSSDSVQEFNMSTPWDLSTASFVKQSVDLDTLYDGFANPQGLWVNADGSRMYLGDSAQDSIMELTLSTPYDVSTISLTNTFPIGENVAELFFA